MNDERRTQALLLSRELGDPAKDWAILAEGNVSALAPDGTMYVKASGASMRLAEPDDYVHVRLAPLIDLLDDPTADDATVADALMGSRIDGDGKRPSVEALLHAVCLDEGVATFVGHTHPTSVNTLLCSDRASALVDGGLFPDQIVILGRHQLLVPYVDPGLPLARHVRTRLREFLARHGTGPKVIYLTNHGMFALGRSPEEVLQITQMATKSARILQGALAVGSPVHLTDEHSDRIDTRPDEVLRRRLLEQQDDQRLEDIRATPSQIGAEQ